MLFGAVDDGLFRALLTIHLVMAVAWIGGGLMLTMQAERARRAADREEMVKVAIQADWFATRVFIPGALVLLAAGIGMVVDGHIGFGKPFVDVGLVGWAVSFAIGAGFLGPQSGQVKSLVAAGGTAVDEAVFARVLRIVWVARVDLVVLFAVIVNMAVKPGGGIS